MYPIVSYIVCTPETDNYGFFSICDPDRYTIGQFFINILCMRTKDSEPLHNFTIKYDEFLDTLYVYATDCNTLYDIWTKIHSDLKR